MQQNLKICEHDKRNIIILRNTSLDYDVLYSTRASFK